MTNAEHTPDWQRLRAYFDARPQFVDRLIDKLGWPSEFASAALLEYQRYCWLATRSDEPLSPSEIVDQVWHLHLQHTRDYWDVFCAQVLGCPLHHEPGEPTPEARKRHWLQYAETLARYERAFGVPPEAFWPVLGQGPRYRWVDVSGPTRSRSIQPRNMLVSSLAALIAMLLPLAAFALPLGVLDWSGADFLRLFLLLFFASVVLSQLLRRMLRASAQAQKGSLLSASKFSPLEYAYLAGGPTRFVDAAVADLLARELVRWEPKKGLVVSGSPSGLSGELRAVFEAIRREPQPLRLRARLREAMRPLRERLERHGLIFDTAAAWRIQLGSLLFPGAVLLLGIAKIAVGISRDRPVLYLVLLCLLLAVYVIALLLRWPQATQRVDALLKQARRQHSTTLRAPSPQNLGLAVALLGTGAMVGTAYAGYHRDRVSSSDGSSSSSDSGGGGSDGGGGSGCGGCGGGGD